MKNKNLEKLSDVKMEKITGGETNADLTPTHYCFDTGTFISSDYKCSYDVGKKVYGTLSI